MKRARWWLLAFFGASLAISISAAQVAMALLLIEAAVAARRGERDGGGASVLDWPILIFILSGLASTFMSDTAVVLKGFSSQTPFLLFWLAVRSWTPEENTHWVRWLCIAAAVTSAFAGLQVLLNVDRYPAQDELVVPAWLQSVPENVLRWVALRNERAVGTRSHPLTFAEGLLIAISVLAAAPLARAKREVKAKWAGLVLIAAAILFSESRAVWLGLMANGLVLAWFWRKNRAARVAFAVGFIGIGLAVAASPKLRARAISIVSFGKSQTDGGSRNTRLELWAAAANTVREHPVFGVGIRGLKLIVNDPLLGTPRPWSEAHNIFLQMAAERGLIGLGLFVWILIVSFKLASRAPPGWREAGLLLLIGMIVAGMSESWIRDKEVAMIFWSCLGAVERWRLAKGAARPGAAPTAIR